MRWLMPGPIFLLSLLLVLGCSGGRSSTLDPDRLILWSSPELHSGELLEVEAELPAGSTALIWNFGGGAEPNTSADVRPHIRLLEPGTYQGTLSWTEAQGRRSSLHFAIEVLGGLRPIVRQLHSAPLTWGRVGESVQLNPDIEGEASSFEWTFSGGVTPLNSTGRTPTLACLERGEYLATLVVRNAAGQTSAPVSVTYWIVDAGSAWEFLHPTKPDDQVRLAIAGDRIGYFYSRYVDGFSKDWFYTQAVIAEPRSAADWRHTLVARQQYKDDRNETGPVSVGVVNDRPVLVFANATQNQWGLTAASAASSQPATPADWSVFVFPAEHKHFTRCAVIEDDGRIVLFGTPQDNSISELPQRAFLAQANGPLPESSADFQQTVIDFHSSRYIDALVNVQGRLVLFDGGLIGWPQGGPAELPAGWDWSQYSDVAFGTLLSAQVAGPTMYVAHKTRDDQGNSTSVLVRGTSAGGVVPTDWNTTTIDPEADGHPLGALLLDADRIFYATNHAAEGEDGLAELSVFQSNSLTPAGPADWAKARLGGAPQSSSFPRFGATSDAVMLLYGDYGRLKLASLKRIP